MADQPLYDSSSSTHNAHSSYDEKKVRDKVSNDTAENASENAENVSVDDKDWKEVSSAKKPLPQTNAQAQTKPPHVPKTYAQSLQSDSIRPDTYPANEIKPAYDAVFFDLDGTLIDTSMDKIMPVFADLIDASAPRGIDPKRFSYAVGKAGYAVDQDTSRTLNNDVFWEEFEKAYELPVTDQVRNYYKRFNEEEFPKLGKYFHVNPDAVGAIAALRSLGYPLFLTTQPVFSRPAIIARIHWAGLDPSDFMRVTMLTNSRGTKPNVGYFKENLAIGGFDASRVLMVGNDTTRDAGCLNAGLDLFLDTDHLINKNHFDVHNVKHGSMAQFSRWVQKWPACTWKISEKLAPLDPNRPALEDPDTSWEDIADQSEQNSGHVSSRGDHASSYEEHE